MLSVVDGVMVNSVVDGVLCDCAIKNENDVDAKSNNSRGLRRYRRFDVVAEVYAKQCRSYKLQQSRATALP